MRSGQVGRAIGQQAGGFELHRHVGDLPLQSLQVSQPTRSGRSLTDVVSGELERALRRADAHRRVAEALVVEVEQQRLEALGRTLEEHVLGLDPDVVERELRFGAAVQAHVLVRARDAEQAQIGRAHV